MCCLKGYTNKLNYVRELIFTKQSAYTLIEFLQFLPRFSTRNPMNQPAFLQICAIINDVTLLWTTTVLSNKINWTNPASCLRDALSKLSPFHVTCFAGSTYFNLFVCPFKQRNMSVMTRVPNFIRQFDLLSYLSLNAMIINYCISFFISCFRRSMASFRNVNNFLFSFHFLTIP